MSERALQRKASNYQSKKRAARAILRAPRAMERAADRAVLDVAEVAARVRSSVEAAAVRGIAVRGEIRSHREVGGHHFFDLCGAANSISCVAWSSAGIQISEGVAVLTVRSPSWDARRGRLQLVISACEAVCAGADARALLREQLTREGLLPREPRPLPCIPLHLVIITSEGSAAESDMLQGRRERWPSLRTTCVHTRVQGREARQSLVDSLGAVQHLRPPADLVVCSRGGGGAAELSEVFDDEAVVRAILRMQVPVICAVGHECDRLLAEEAADYRAKTPSSAIDMAVPWRRDVLGRVQGARERLLEAVSRRSLARSAELASPLRALSSAAQVAASRAHERTRSLRVAFRRAALAGTRCASARLVRAEAQLWLRVVETRARTASSLGGQLARARKTAGAIATLVAQEGTRLERLRRRVRTTEASRRAALGTHRAAEVLRSFEVVAHRAGLGYYDKFAGLRRCMRESATPRRARGDCRQLLHQLGVRGAASTELCRRAAASARNRLALHLASGLEVCRAACARLMHLLAHARTLRKRSWPRVFSEEGDEVCDSSVFHVGQSVRLCFEDGEVVVAVKRIKRGFK